MSTVFYMNKQGGTGTEDLCQEAMSIWQVALELNAFIQVICIPGKPNVEANGFSRSGNLLHKWSLKPGAHLCSLGFPQDRFVCNPLHYKCEEVLFLCWQEQTRLGGCFSGILGGRTVLCIPSIPFVNQGVGKG